MIGIMNDVIQTAIRRTKPTTSPNDKPGLRQAPRANRDSARKEFERNLSHPRGYW